MKPNMLEDQNLARKIGQMVLEKPHDEEMNMNKLQFVYNEIERIN